MNGSALCRRRDGDRPGQPSSARIWPKAFAAAGAQVSTGLQVGAGNGNSCRIWDSVAIAPFRSDPGGDSGSGASGTRMGRAPSSRTARRARRKERPSCGKAARCSRRRRQAAAAGLHRDRLRGGPYSEQATRPFSPAPPRPTGRGRRTGRAWRGAGPLLIHTVPAWEPLADRQRLFPHRPTRPRRPGRIRWRWQRAMVRRRRRTSSSASARPNCSHSWTMRGLQADCREW